MELIAIIILIVLLIAGEITLYSRRGGENITYRCAFSSREVVVGESIEFVETLENAKALPLPVLKVELTMPAGIDFPETYSTVTGDNRYVTGFFSLRGNARTRRVWHVGCEKRGVYAVEHAVVVTQDLLGTVHISLAAEETGEAVTVLPRRYTAAGRILPIMSPQFMGDMPVRGSLYTDPSLPVGIREYTYGDAINQIHWKASAHMGQLMVRQEERCARQNVTVILAFETNAPESGEHTLDRELIERTIEIGAQCLWECFTAGWEVEIYIGDADAMRLAVHLAYAAGRAAYHRALQTLAGLTLREVMNNNRLLGQAGWSGSGRYLYVGAITDKDVARWKQRSGGYVVVADKSRDYGKCADRRL